MFQRRPARAKPAPPRPAALPQGLVDEFQDRPFLGGGYGARIVPQPPEPTPAPAQPFQPPPPDWEEEARERAERTNYFNAVEIKPTGSAIEAMMHTAQQLGEVEELPPPGPPEVLPPLEPISIPEPDWEAEARERVALERAERQRLARAARAELLRELLDEDTEVRPARKGKS